MKTGRFRPYLDAVLEQVPRLLGQLDRNPSSGTYGCFDRQYWHYGVSDFPCSRHQEAALTLTMLYRAKAPNNPYFKSPKIKEWINASFRFWVRMQPRDGSASEWYPNEHSFGATAFGAYAISEALLIMGREAESRGLVEQKLLKAAEWLMKKHETRAQNQECGAALAMYNIYMLTGNEKYRKNAEERVALLASMQKSEGWFKEYGGADIGYLSLALFYLAELYKKSGMQMLRGIIDSAVSFISWFAHPDMTFGGAYGSRNTEYLFPFCFEMLGSGKAAMVACHARKSIQERRSVSPFSLDDRYLSYISYIYLKSYLESRALKNVAAPPYRKNSVHVFEDAGLIVYSNNGLYFICNCRKGGAFFAFSGGSSCQDSGIEADAGGKFISGYFGDFSHSFDGKKLTVSGRMSQLRNTAMSPKRSILLRAFQLTFGRSSVISLFLKKWLRGRMITGSRNSRLTFAREITLGRRISVTDTVEGSGIKSVTAGTKASYAYVPSSRYFQSGELEYHGMKSHAHAGKAVANRRLAPFSVNAFGANRIAKKVVLARVIE